MKKAPVVSPAQAKAGLPPGKRITPASCRPVLKMYWSGVPLGQKPPPTTGELFGSTQSSPMLLMPQKIRLTSITPNVNANRFIPLRLAGRPGAGLAVAVAPVASVSSATTTAERPARVHQVERIASLDVRSHWSGALEPAGRRSRRYVVRSSAQAPAVYSA